jgi:drug/metabolite transporter (DMT)-like permease
MRDVRGHSVSPRPPGAAEETFALASRRVIRFAVGYAFVVVAISALGLAGYAAIRSGAADPNSVGTQASVAIGTTLTGLIGLVCVIGLLVSAIVWIVSAHRLRPSGPGVVGYLAMALCLVLIGLAYVIPARVSSLTGSVVVEAVMRIAAVAVLIVAVVLVRSGVRAETGLDIPNTRRTMRVSSDDWNASKWDPEVLGEIDRRRGSEDI